MQEPTLTLRTDMYVLTGHGAPLRSTRKNFTFIIIQGNTSLHIACIRDYVDIMQFLLSRGADVTVKNKVGPTKFFDFLQYVCRSWFVMYMYSMANLL
jgi:hypothetical protein